MICTNLTRGVGGGGVWGHAPPRKLVIKKSNELYPENQTVSIFSVTLTIDLEM